MKRRRGTSFEKEKDFLRVYDEGGPRRERRNDVRLYPREPNRPGVKDRRTCCGGRHSSLKNVVSDT